MHALVLVLLFAAAPDLAAPVAPDGAAGDLPVTVTATLTPEVAGAVDAQAAGSLLDVTLAQPLVLTLSARSARDTQLFPPLTPAVGTFAIGDALPGTEKVTGDVKETTWRWKVLPVRMGIEKVPPIELPFRTIEGAEGSVATELVRVRVRGLLENEADPALGQSPPPVDVIATNWALIWALSVGGALVLGTLLSWLVLLALRQRFAALKPAPPPRPAIDVALERLAQIDQASAAELDGAQRLAATIDAMREYLGGRYQIDALEMTTPELRLALPALDLKSITPLEIEALLNDADLVKFARIVPPESAAREKSPLVRRIVTETWEPPAEDKPEIERREAATAKQRIAATLLDFAIAGLVAVLLAGVTWATGLVPLAFTPLVGVGLVGLLMTLRDLPAVSLGKRLLRLDIVTRDELQTDTTAEQRFKRNLLLLLWPLTAPLELLVLRQHPLVLRVGDMWADTEVVRQRAQK